MVNKSKSIERIMFYGAKAETFRFAANLRKNMTDAELILWDRLKQNKLNGFRFKPQHPIKTFIADFYCHKAKLVVEIDGDIHKVPEKKEYDMNRNHEFRDLCLTVIRFTNSDVINNTDWVLQQIAKHLTPEPQ